MPNNIDFNAMLTAVRNSLVAQATFVGAFKQAARDAGEDKDVFLLAHAEARVREAIDTLAQVEAEPTSSNGEVPPQPAGLQEASLIDVEMAAMRELNAGSNRKVQS